MSGVLKYYNPITPSMRNTVSYVPAVEKRARPEKSLTKGLRSTGGRSGQGRITVRFRGGGCKRSYRIVDFKHKIYDVEAEVMSIQYDPNRTANIALIERSGVKSYVIAPEGLKVGNKIVSSNSADAVAGNSSPLSNIPVGSSVYNIETKVGAGAIFARSAGSAAILMGIDAGKAFLKLPSGEVRAFSDQCWASIGVVSNVLRKNIKIGKAGSVRHMGRRPHVRGAAMNPVDHPLGGGEGKAPRGRHSVSPWGQKSKGLKTRFNPRTDVFIISSRKRKGSSNS